MVVWFIDRDETEKSIPKERARWVAAQAVAAEIQTLLDPAAGLRLCDRRLQGSDIAVLVRTHAEGDRVRGCLRSRGIASVEQGAGDVFQSHEAADLEWVLRAVLEPHVLSYLKAALATELLGKTSIEVWDIDHDEAVWEDYLKRFQEYHRQWRDRGFMLAFPTSSKEKRSTGACSRSRTARAGSQTSCISRNCSRRVRHAIGPE